MLLLTCRPSLTLWRTGSEKLEKQLTKLEAKGRQLSNCSALIAICLKRVPNKKGALMPEWEEIASCAIAVQNMHLVLTAEDQPEAARKCVLERVRVGGGRAFYCVRPASARRCRCARTATRRS